MATISIYSGDDYPLLSQKISQHTSALEKKGFSKIVHEKNEDGFTDAMNALMHRNLFATDAYLVIRMNGFDELVKAFISWLMEHEAEIVHEVLLIWNEKIKATDAKIFSKKWEHYAHNKKSVRDARVFTLAEYLVVGRAKDAWLLYQSLYSEGATVQQLVGGVWWQYKTLALILASPSNENPGLKPFVYSKSLGLIKKASLTRSGVIRDMRTLLSIIHEGVFSGRGDEDFERFILTCSA